MIKSFQLGAKKYKVVKAKHDTTNLGLCYSALGMIKVQEIYDGKEIPEDCQEQALYHEVVHAILNDIGRVDLSDNENLVQSFGTLMHQFVKTMK